MALEGRFGMKPAENDTLPAMLGFATGVIGCTFQSYDGWEPPFTSSDGVNPDYKDADQLASGVASFFHWASTEEAHPTLPRMALYLGFANWPRAYNYAKHRKDDPRFLTYLEMGKTVIEARLTEQLIDSKGPGNALLAILKAQFGWDVQSAVTKTGDPEAKNRPVSVNIVNYGTEQPCEKTIALDIPKTG